jgi:Na+-transporting NADH:ubiquinone oxidoreductase subunit C
VSYSNTYIIGFAAGICVFCSIFVSGSAVALKERQVKNKILDRQKNVISVSGLVEDIRATSPEEVQRLFNESITPKLINLATGEVHTEAVTVSCDSGDVIIEPELYDQQRALRDSCLSGPAPERNNAKLMKVPKFGLVYEVIQDGALSAIILPIEGKGLWSTLYGFISLEGDAATVRGLTFYQHAETPGLGGEVDNPKWKAQWAGKDVYGDDGEIAIEVVKGAARNKDHEIDGLSGATLTSRGVSYLVEFWIGDDGFGQYLETIRKEG